MRLTVGDGKSPLRAKRSLSVVTSIPHRVEWAGWFAYVSACGFWLGVWFGRGEARSLSYEVGEAWSRKGLSPHTIHGGIKNATFAYGCSVGGGRSRGLGAPAPFLSVRCR